MRVWKQAAALAVAVLAAAMLASCSAASEAPSSDDTGAGIVKDAPTYNSERAYVDAPDAQPLTLDAQGWWAMDSYVDYGIKVTNPNTAYTACNTQVQVTLYDESDQVAGTYTQTINEVGPGQTIGFAGEVGDGWAPARVDVALVPASTQWEDGASWTAPIAIDTCSEEDKLYFRYELSGDLTNHTDVYIANVGLSALLYDEDGNIVAGYPARAYKIKAGQTKSYLQTIDSAPSHARVELYAQVTDE